jgi:HEAT repeat protein
MKISKIFITGISLIFISLISYSQDKRTLETKVADLLARFPAIDLQLTDKLMDEMLSLGDAGLKQVCDNIIPAGTGNDTPQRFAVESMSRYLSQKGKESDRIMWEKMCIAYTAAKSDNEVKDFFMKQLQLVGTSLSAESMKDYLFNSELCEPALAVIAASDSKAAEAIFADALKNMEHPCASALMNHLASMGSALAVNEYIARAATGAAEIKASAYNALAMSGSPQANAVLSDAAKKAAYRWETTGSVEALLNYAKVVGKKGNIKASDKICRLIIKECDEEINIHYKILALNIFVGFHGMEAFKILQAAVSHPDKQYRNAAMIMSLQIPGNEVTKRWIGFYPKAIPAARPELISLLGISGDVSALPLVTSALSDNDPAVRSEAAHALVRLNGEKAIPSLVDYMTRFSDSSDQEAAKSALMTILGNKNMPDLLPVLKDGSPVAKKSAIELISWNSDNQYFPLVLQYAGSSDTDVSIAAVKALQNLAGQNDQGQLIELLKSTSDPVMVADLQTALAAAAVMNPDPDKRSDYILKAIGTGDTETRALKIKVIPVLAKTGGAEALQLVKKEFEAGDSDMRDACFSALMNWNDYSASSGLYEICASGNKKFEGQAFEGYLRQIRSSGLPDDQKLLLFRKIMPFALTDEKKNRVVAETGRLKTYPALFFTSAYLDDPSTSADAARAAMGIALPSAGSETGLRGKMVKEILVKAVTKLTGPEKDYEKEMINKYIALMPAGEGFVTMFNGKDLTGWQGLVENPLARAKMKPAVLAKKQAEANKKVPMNWSVKDGMIWFSGKGDNLCSVKEYGDFEMYVDWLISKEGDSGIYLRGTPQVQIWDTSRVDAGAQVGSGGLYNNQKYPSKPLKVADNPVGDWNTFRIIMIGEKVSVWLNGELVVDNVILENFWDRNIAIFPKGAIELQAHGTDLAFRDIYVREINDNEYSLTPEEKAEGFVALFNGRNLDNWTGNKTSYIAGDGNIVVKPGDGSGGNLFTEKEYADFIFRFEFQLTPGANNGLGIRAPLSGDAAYSGMELQILDDTAPVYANLQPYQYHGSVYGIIPAKRGHLKPVGEWNYQEVLVQGTKIKIILNGAVIVDGDLAEPRENGTIDKKDHPGLQNKTGHIGFLGHGSELKFRNIRIKDLSK